MARGSFSLKPSEPKELRETQTLLTSLEIALGYGTETKEAYNAIADQYNRCLVLLQGVLQDPVLQSVFPRLEQVTTDANELQNRFSELRRARHALYGYIANFRASGRLTTLGSEGDSVADTDTGRP